MKLYFYIRVSGRQSRVLHLLYETGFLSVQMR
nr:MAG TPA: hypothetical protein [Caudoviricetes sp.]